MSDDQRKYNKKIKIANQRQADKESKANESMRKKESRLKHKETCRPPR